MKKAVIRCQNGYSWLKTNSDDVSLTLWRALRFRAKSYYHSRLYKQKLWDGFDEFFKKDSGRFLTGLMPEVEATLKHLNCEYTIQDERSNYEFAHKQIDTSFLDQWVSTTSQEMQDKWAASGGMHDYQSDLTNQVLKHKRGVIFAPTSAGKSLIMVLILKCLRNNTPTLLLGNKTSVADQNYTELKQWGFKNIGRLYDSYNEPHIITCANVQSLHKIEKVLPKIEVLIVDEIHEMMSKVPKKYYAKMKSACVRLALSATPFKYGGTDKTQKFSVKGYFGPVLKTKSDAANEHGVLTTKNLQDKGILSKAHCTFWPIDTPQIPYDIYLDAVTNGIQNNWHFHDVIKRLVTTKLTGRTLILVERLEHGDYLNSILENSLWVQGKDNLETRRYVINELKTAKGNKVGIATKGIFNTAINVYLHNLINASGGKADHQIIQMFGRGLRVAPDKDMLEYHDFVFSINEYLESHSLRRIKILKKEGHIVCVKDKIDF